MRDREEGRKEERKKKGGEKSNNEKKKKNQKNKAATWWKKKKRTQKMVSVNISDLYNGIKRDPGFAQPIKPAQCNQRLRQSNI